MNILVGVISPAAIWVLPASFVAQLRADFPHHTFLEAWDRDAIRRQLPAADVGDHILRGEPRRQPGVEAAVGNQLWLIRVRSDGWGNQCGRDQQHCDNSRHPTPSCDRGSAPNLPRL